MVKGEQRENAKEDCIVEHMNKLEQSDMHRTVVMEEQIVEDDSYYDYLASIVEELADEVWSCDDEEIEEDADSCLCIN